MRKTICVLLVVLMVACLIPSFAFAAENPNGQELLSCEGVEGEPGAEEPGAEEPGAQEPEGEEPGATPGGSTPGYVPWYPTVTESLSSAKTNATNGLSTYAAANKYEEAEQAEIDKLLEQAKADISKATTAEEIAAIETATKAAIDAIDTAEEKALIREVEGVKKGAIKASSKSTTLHGKKAIKVSWKTPEGLQYDGFEIYRSTKKSSGYGTEPFFTTKNKHYTNNKSLKAGTRYYYKVRAYKTVNGRDVYTGWSTKAWRIAK